MTTDTPAPRTPQDAVELMPADVLLFAAAKPSAVHLASPVVHFARPWTHAAIYAGDGQIIEATLLSGLHGAVIERSIDVHRGRAIMRGRRAFASVSDPQRVVDAARTLINTPYSLSRAVLASMPTVVATTLPADAQRPDDGLICTDLVFTAYFSAGFALTDRARFSVPVSPVTLLDIPTLEWSEIRSVHVVGGPVGPANDPV